jgi:hypothetical protein
LKNILGQIKKEIKKEIAYPNVWNAAKAALSKKLIAITIYIKKVE